MLGRVEPQHPCHGVEDGVGDVLAAALFAPDAVVDADACEPGDLLAAQPRQPAPAVRGQARVLRLDSRPPGLQDVADLVAYVTSRPAHVNLRQVIVLPTGQV